MNNDEISRIIENLDEDLIRSAEEKRAAAMLDPANGDIKSKKRSAFIKTALGSVTAIAACAIMAIGAVSWLKTANPGPDVVKNTSVPTTDPNTVTTSAPLPVTDDNTDPEAPADVTTAVPPAVTDDNAVTSVPEDNTALQAPSGDVQNSVNDKPQDNAVTQASSNADVSDVTKKPEESSTTKASSSTEDKIVTQKPTTDKTEKTEEDEIVELPPENASLVKVVTAAHYPKLAKCPDYSSDNYMDDFYAWTADNKDRYAAKQSLDNRLFDFYKKSSKEFLKTSDGDNLVYSPVNVYMALSMLAETTDGESRAQILRLLGIADIEKLREYSALMWKANYYDDGQKTSVLANSLWLSDRVDFKQNTLETLAEDYKASTYSGTMGSDELNQALRNWLNEQTGGLLKNYVGDIKLSPESILAIASTVYFNARWNYDVGFSEKSNETKIFHSPSGDVEKVFMHSYSDPGVYYYNDDFGAVNLSFTGGSTMWFILPDEDKTVDKLLDSGEFLDMIANPSGWNRRNYKIHYLVPKFDVSSQMMLKKGLKSMGVTDVFSSADSDFSALTNNSKGIYLGTVEHCARVMIDEEGCTAAAFTVEIPTGAGLWEQEYEEIEFILDRPFIFVIDNGSGQPLFVGVVNDP